MIYNYPDTLLDKWVDLCEGLLSERLERETNDLNELLGSSGSDNPSRAKEFMNVGFLKFSISKGSDGFNELRNDKPIQSDLGYIAYLIAKAKELESSFSSSPYSALCSLCVVQQFEEVENIKISLSSILIKLIKIFPIPDDTDKRAYLRYLSAAMFCELNFNKQTFFDALLLENDITLRIVERKTDIVRAEINSSDDIKSAIDNKVSLTGIYYEKGSIFFIGNHKDEIPRGLFYTAYLYFQDFLEGYCQIEMENIKNSLFKSLYIEDQCASVIPVISCAFTEKNKAERFKNVMINIEQGCKKALELLNWNEEIAPDIDSTNPQNIIFFGAPGTGKSYRVDNIISGVNASRVERVTFHPEYDYASFVGCYKPIMEISIDGKSEEIKYKFVPQSFTNIYVQSWNNISESHFLVIEEINRGNCAEIFGDIFQLLDRSANYSISPSVELLAYLNEHINDKETSGLKDKKLKLPPNLNIMATMNTSDQSLMPMDSAFKRRWAWEYIPICYDAEYENGTKNPSINYEIELLEDEKYKWIKFIQKANEIIKENPHLGMDKCIGNFFIDPENNTIKLSDFINKVIFYLWNDVFKDEEDSIFEDGVMYEDFFPVNTNGVIEARKLLNNLEVESS